MPRPTIDVRKIVQEGNPVSRSAELSSGRHRDRAGLPLGAILTVSDFDDGPHIDLSRIDEGVRVAVDARFLTTWTLRRAAAELQRRIDEGED